MELYYKLYIYSAWIYDSVTGLQQDSLFQFKFLSVCGHHNDESFLGATNIGFVIGR